MDKFSVYWHDEAQTILHQVVYTGFSVQDAMDGIARGRAMISNTKHNVALFTEICQPFVLPKGYMNILRITAPNIQQREVIHVVVGSPILIRSVLQLSSRMNIPNLKYVRIADSVEQGLELCRNALEKSKTPIAQG